MANQERSYHCHVCGWQGRAEPLDAEGAALCDRCGIYLYPLTWGQTWGLALIMILSVLAALAFIVRVLRR